MSGGTLIASKAVKLHSHFKSQFEGLGFTDVAFTTAEKDGLKFAIDDYKPRLFIIESEYYKCCTPYHLTDLKERFPDLNVAAVSFYNYPPDLAMYFIVNGVKSYVNFYEGVEQYYAGLEKIRDGKEYICPEVLRRFEIRSVYPSPSGIITKRELEVTRLIANGFTGEEIADVLSISLNTVNTHKTNIYTALNVRNENEVIRVALELDFITKEELVFFGRDYVLKPLPRKEERKRRRNK